MSRSINVDVVFGFKTSIELDYKDIRELEDVGITASPVIFTLEEEPQDYIVGKLITCLSSAGEYDSIKFDSTQQAQDKMQKEVFEALDKAGFDVKNKKCELLVNTYYR
jgi:hypothetical protein